jgi:SAM-dependent methyltransferase
VSTSPVEVERPDGGRRSWFIADTAGWRPEVYERWFTWNPMQAALRRREQAAVLGALKGLAQGSDRVLEVGCGTGAYTLELARRCRRVVAVDASAGMLGYLDRRLRREGVSNVETRAGTLPDRLAVDGAHDGVLAVGVLNYLPDLDGALGALAATLRRGGWAVVTVPLRSPGGWLYRVGEALTRRRVALRSEAAVRAAALGAGLRPVRVASAGFSRRGFLLVLAARRRPPEAWIE